MLLIGHVGITLGVSVLVTGAVTAIRRSRSRRDGNNPSQASSDTRNVQTRWFRQADSWLTALNRVLDVRLILIGSLLPDIIDKSLGLVLLRDTLSNGRIFSHTLLFPVVLLLTGLYLYRRSAKGWFLALALGSATHLVLDAMWQTPRALFWPAYGLAFERYDLTGLVERFFEKLLSNPAVYISEIIGVIVLGWFGWNLLRRRKILTFLRRGEVV